MSERDVYVAIMVASARGRELHLSPAELDMLSLDDAVATRAINALTADEADLVRDKGDRAWEKINPRKPREPANSINRHDQ